MFNNYCIDFVFLKLVTMKLSLWPYILVTGHIYNTENIYK